METFSLPPIEMAQALKLEILCFIEDFLDKLPAMSERQRRVIVDAIMSDGWGFFADELDDYFEMCDDCEVLDNGNIKFISE